MNHWALSRALGTMQNLNLARLFRSTAPSPLSWSTYWARLFYLTGFSGLLGVWLALATIAQVMPTLKPEEQNAGRQLSAISRAQRAYYAQQGKFAISLQDLRSLDPNLVLSDPVYNYSVVGYAYGTTATADPRQPDMKGAKAELKWNAVTRQIEGRLCITAQSGQQGDAANQSFLDPARPCEFPSVRR